MAAEFVSTSSRKFEREINQSLLAPINFSEINARRDLANLVTNPMRKQRSLGIIENDTFFIIEPARTLVDLGDDRI